MKAATLTLAIVFTSATLLASAQAGTQPQASATPQESAAPDIRKQLVLSNPNFDPCGGYQELLTKYLVGTPCVFRLGQGIFAASYYGIWAPKNTTLILNGIPATSSTSINIHAYPKPQVLFGISNRDMFTYYSPSYQDLLMNGQLQAAGATDQVFSYKREVYYNAKGGFLGSIQLVYNAPTGSQVFTGGGPLYKINPIVLFPIGYRLAINFNLPAINAPYTSETGANGRAWSFAPTIGFTWRSPGAFMYNLVWGFDSAKGQETVTNVLTQLIGRHFAIEAGYAGNGNNLTEFLTPIVGLRNETWVNIVNVGLIWQWGSESETLNGGPKLPPRPACPTC